MAGSTITSHPAGTRRTTTRRPARKRKSTARRRPAVAGSRKRKTRRPKAWHVGRLWPGALLVVAVLVGGAWDTETKGGPAVPGHCTIAGLSMTLTTEQVTNAATIAQVGRDRGLPERAVVIALATAQQESRLRNLDYGDRDSLGLFQQRPSQGWGSAEQVQDPVYAAGKFFDHLVEVPGWEAGRLTEVSQSVQRSGFPEAYQQWEAMATALAGALLATTPTALSCGYDPAGEAAPVADRTAAGTAALRREAGTPTVETDGTISVAGVGWPEATWAVAHAERFQLTSVAMDGWRWTPDGGWETAPAYFALPLQLRLV